MYVSNCSFSKRRHTRQPQNNKGVNRCQKKAPRCSETHLSPTDVRVRGYPSMKVTTRLDTSSHSCSGRLKYHILLLKAHRRSSHSTMLALIQISSACQCQVSAPPPLLPAQQGASLAAGEAGGPGRLGAGKQAESYSSRIIYILN